MPGVRGSERWGHHPSCDFGQSVCTPLGWKAESPAPSEAAVRGQGAPPALPITVWQRRPP